jgi:hypothetical protein
MPMLWRRIAWFIGFAIAVLVALWMRSLGYGWIATFTIAVVIWIVLPFILSQVWAAFVLGRVHSRMRQVDGLAERISDAIKGLPSEQQEAVAKKIIDESLK